MITTLTANLLRLLPNQAEKKPLVEFQPVQTKTDILIDNYELSTAISCYYPIGAVERRPVYLNFHGGAFIMHSKEMDDPYCRMLANETKCVVVNVDYPKAPEYPFPIPVQQSYDILNWIKHHAEELRIDPEKIIIGGQSSGANLAAVLCMLLKERHEPQPLLQVLSCPMLDFSTPHAEKPEPDPWRSKYPQVANFLNHCYVPESNQAAHPYASPVLAERLEGLAPALIIAAEHDAFRPEAEKYTNKLIKSGVQVQLELFENCTHAFHHLGPKDKAQQAWRLIAESLIKAVQ
ncbi:alpha/beta hydrolase [Halobacillus rhizosphaerae]|uniref:alpha/beta hydrolase n=1 Tax=Halobacillus rhizosphaerae TaxID=3064889 RepID=UPI00398AAD79